MRLACSWGEGETANAQVREGDLALGTRVRLIHGC